MNVFNNSEKYIEEISQKIRIKENNRKQFHGKSMAFLFLTKICDVECSHCFFKSRKNVNSDNSIEYELSEEGLNKVIQFINESNNGYLAVLGGGEPFTRFDYILEVIRRVKTDRLVLVTSGNWGENKDKALEKIKLIKEALNSRQDDLKLVLRLSVDKWHILKIGEDSILNILSIMKEEANSNFLYELHTLTSDDTCEKVLKKIGNYRICNYQSHVSDNEEILKLGYARYIAVFEDGLEIKVGIAQKFNSNLKVNLKEAPSNLEETISYFDNDIQIDCFGNPSLVFNKNKVQGLDFLISYNGNVATWGNDQTYDMNNIYIHNYQEVLKRSFDNIISYSFIDKGYLYRENIFNEINTKAVIRSKAINIRDYAGVSLFEERASVLYYAIRVIQDYLKENILSKMDLIDLSEDLKTAISLSKRELVKLYQTENYTILDQYIQNVEYTVVEWNDLFELIRLGHYNASGDKIKKALEVYNSRFYKDVNSLEEFKNNSDEQYARLLDRLAKIDKKVICKSK